MNPDDELLAWVEDEIKGTLNQIKAVEKAASEYGGRTVPERLFILHGRMYAFVDVRKQMIKRKMGMTFWKKHIEEMPFVAENK